MNNIKGALSCQYRQFRPTSFSVIYKFGENEIFSGDGNLTLMADINFKVPVLSCALSPFQMPPLLFKPAGLVHPEELQDHHDYHDDADDVKDAVHTFSPAIDVLNIDFFNFL